MSSQKEALNYVLIHQRAKLDKIYLNSTSNHFGTHTHTVGALRFALGVDGHFLRPRAVRTDWCLWDMPHTPRRLWAWPPRDGATDDAKRRLIETPRWRRRLKPTRFNLTAGWRPVRSSTRDVYATRARRVRKHARAARISNNR